ncbi:MAG: NAD(P)/FAD-dependent oxidoreductase [Gammaproteobacteria bacterium]|nr:NAD(P)/FAD-dependent oxidoreductase [Gammaproteobacteria bacterium]
MTTKTYDAIVIGAGHNGLTNAAFLAKAGLRVLVVEKNEYVGGATVSRELHEGWKYSNCSYVCSLFRPEIYNALDLGRHGLKVIPLVSSMTFKQDGDYFGSYHDPNIRRRELMRHSMRDADAAMRFDADVLRWCKLVRNFLLRTPPDPGSFRPRDAFEFAYLMKKFYELSESQIYEFIRFFTMSIAEYLENYFENETILAHYSGGSIIGTGLGVYSPGTAYVLLHHAMGDVDGNVGSWGFARGGMGAVAGALASSFQSYGGEIRTDAEVVRISVTGNRTSGVQLASGEEISAKIVVSNLDAKRTFTKIMDGSDLPPKLIAAAQNFKIRGSSGKLNIALDGMPTFPSLPNDSPLTLGHMHFTDTLRRLEKAYDDWKDDRWSADPYCDTLIPSQYDPSLAPPGKHMMTVFVQYCPVEPEGGWTDQKRDQFGQTVIDQIADYSPDFKELLLHAEIRTPHDMEEDVGLTEGNIFQGELTFDQLAFNRPFPGYAQYRGPVKGMYMCGSSTHPGGGVMGAPGANAAREILRDLKKPDTTPEAFSDD